jgi:hypothetical protein
MLSWWRQQLFSILDSRSSDFVYVMAVDSKMYFYK